MKNVNSRTRLSWDYVSKVVLNCLMSGDSFKLESLYLANMSDLSNKELGLRTRRAKELIYKNSVRQALGALRRLGFVEFLGNSTYFITDLGKKYIEEDPECSSLRMCFTDLMNRKKIVQTNPSAIQYRPQERTRRAITVLERNKDFRLAVLLRDDNTCQLCSRSTALSSAHIVAVSEGGSDDVRNGITLCVNHHDDFDKYRLAITIEGNVEFAKDYSADLLQVTKIQVDVNKFGKEEIEHKYERYKMKNAKNAKKVVKKT